MSSLILQNISQLKERLYGIGSVSENFTIMHFRALEPAKLFCEICQIKMGRQIAWIQDEYFFETCLSFMYFILLLKGHRQIVVGFNPGRIVIE